MNFFEGRNGSSFEFIERTTIKKDKGFFLTDTFFCTGKIYWIR